jgi:hypothetical protein
MPDFVQQLRGRLLKLGCPMARIDRLVREVADHREDLKQAGLAEGLSEADAEARADGSLGDPLVLAEQTMMSVRRSTWWGRHYFVTFVVLPLLAYPVLWMLLVIPELLLIFKLGYNSDDEKFDAALNNPITFHHIFLGYQLVDYLAVVLSTMFICWLARRAAVKLKWMLIAGAICSVLFAICFTNVKAIPDGVTVTHVSNQHGRQTDVKTTTNGFIVSLDGSVNPAHAVMRGTIPLLVIGAAYLVQLRAVRRFQQKMTCCD